MFLTDRLQEAKDGCCFSFRKKCPSLHPSSFRSFSDTIHCLVALLCCFQHLQGMVLQNSQSVCEGGVMQSLGFCLGWSQEGIFTCMLTLLLYTAQLPEGISELGVTTAQRHQSTPKSRESCPFLIGIKWNMIFYSNSLLTFILWLLPRWVTGHWSPCSATCEKGVQHREVTCVYQLQNGTYVNTRDLYCLGNKPATVQSCEGRDCLSIWEASEWSKVGTERSQSAESCRYTGLNPCFSWSASSQHWSAGQDSPSVEMSSEELTFGFQTRWVSKAGFRYALVAVSFHVKTLTKEEKCFADLRPEVQEPRASGSI